MKTIIQPKLTLVGAGPGDPDLITIKGVQALGEADIVLYDALVNPELLKYVPLEAKKIYVGKRAGAHSYTQEQINSLIVDFAFTYGHVVRLKGGDPFVFARGQEEIEFAESFNIETQVIPGISSAISVPELQGIPITKRGVNESFWVLTGTTRDGNLSDDIRIAAKTKATVIILMGLKKLPEIVEVYKNEGKGELPVAIIQNGSLPTENIVLGPIDKIVKLTKEEGIRSPVIIVIGEVVNYHSYLKYAQVKEYSLN